MLGPEPWLPSPAVTAADPPGDGCDLGARVPTADKEMSAASDSTRITGTAPRAMGNNLSLENFKIWSGPVIDVARGAFRRL